MNELTIGIIGLLTSIATAWASWYFTRKKYDVEVDNSIIEGMQDSLKFYTSLSDDNKVRLNEMIERSSKIEEENKVLKEENKALKERQEELESELATLKAKVEELLLLKGSIHAPVTPVPTPIKTVKKVKQRNEKV